MFYNLLTAPRTVFNTYQWPGRNGVKISCKTWSGRHVQHVACRAVLRTSSAVQLDRVSIAFILALLCWLKPLSDERN